VQGKLTIVAAAAALLITAPAGAQVSVDAAEGMRVVASETAGLATWSAGGSVHATVLGADGRPKGVARAFPVPAAPGFTLRGAASAWSPRTKRWLLAWGAPDGLRMRFLRRDGRPLGASRLISPEPAGAQVVPLDADVDPVSGRAVFTVNVFLAGTGGVKQVPVDRRGRPTNAWPVRVHLVTPRRAGDFLTVFGSAGDLHLQRMTSAGRLAGPRRQLTFDPAVYEQAPALAVHPRTGKALVIWKSASAIVGRPLRGDGKPTGDVFEVQAGIWNSIATLAPYGRDGWVTAYTREIVGINEVVLQRLDRHGRPAGRRVIVNQGNDDPWPGYPTLAPLGDGVLVGYQHQSSATTHRVIAAAARP
jgi:hypothetical protein